MLFKLVIKKGEINYKEIMLYC